MQHPATQYYNPDLTEEQERQLLRRNYLLLMAGQAALGAIGPDILAVAVEPQPGAVVLHVAVNRRTPEVLEDIEDIADSLETQLAGGPENDSHVLTHVHVGWPYGAWPGEPTYALLYLAKAPEESS